MQTTQEIGQGLQMLHLSDLVEWYASGRPDKLGRHRFYIQVIDWDSLQPSRYLASRGASRIPPRDPSHVDAIEALGLPAQGLPPSCHLLADPLTQKERKKERKKEGSVNRELNS